MGGLERRVRQLEGMFPPPPDPVSPEALPVEAWVEEQMRGYQWTSIFGLEPDEDQFARWYEWRLRGLLFRVGDRIREGGYRLADERAEETIVRRVVDAFEPYAEYWLKCFAQAAPKRELKRRMARTRGWAGSPRS